MFELGTVGDVVVDEMDEELWGADVSPLCDRDSRQENSLFEYIWPVSQATGFLGETSAPPSFLSKPGIIIHLNLVSRSRHGIDLHSKPFL
jgi:hypothetical protein